MLTDEELFTRNDICWNYVVLEVSGGRYDLAMIQVHCKMYHTWSWEISVCYNLVRILTKIGRTLISHNQVFQQLRMLTPRCSSVSLHTERFSWMYQSQNKHENYENQIINGWNSILLFNAKSCKITNAHTFLANMIISFWMNFLLIFLAKNEAHKNHKIL